MANEYGRDATIFMVENWIIFCGFSEIQEVLYFNYLRISQCLMVYRITLTILSYLAFLAVFTQITCQYPFNMAFCVAFLEYPTKTLWAKCVSQCWSINEHECVSEWLCVCVCGCVCVSEWVCVSVWFVLNIVHIDTTNSCTVQNIRTSRSWTIARVVN